MRVRVRALQMSVLHGYCERLLPGSIVITTTRKLPPLDPKHKKERRTKKKAKGGKAARRESGGGNAPGAPRVGVRCRLSLQSSTSLAYAKGRLTFHVYHALDIRS
eukprot:COSAG06_NODE_14173_length_1182_cov_0.978763_2_plen_105_part_00